MEEVKLFLLEVLIEKISFNGALKMEPGLKTLRVQIILSDIVKMELLLNIEISPSNAEVICNEGKSYLFPCNPEILADVVMRKELEIKIRDGFELVGSMKFSFDNRYPEMIQQTGDPVCTMDKFPLHKYLLKIGDCRLFVRLNCCGGGMESAFAFSDPEEENIDDSRTSVPGRVGNDEHDSLTELYSKKDKRFDDTQSEAPPEFQKREKIAPPASCSVYDRPKEKTFLNFQNLQTDFAGSDLLNAEKINQLLCNSKDCPAAKKFKEYGLGPLATTKNMGCVDPDTIPPSTYALSHTYGTFDRYGPYGLFSRPKRLDLPFVPRKNALETVITNGDCKSIVKCNTNEPCPRQITKNVCPLRLTGGGTSRTELRETILPKSPFDVCKDVMAQCDKILNEYRRALGPCGQTVCPFAPNALAEECMKTCDFTRPKNIGPEAKENEAPCKKMPACGSPRCAYSKYKTGLVGDDAQMELAFLPPAIVGRCGHPKCEYPFQQEDLPPIHWECPEPLPKGICRNPDCPYLPPDVKALKLLKKSKAPCGSPSCPYALPPPCHVPTCPFNRKPCPGRKKKVKCMVESLEAKCGNPNCPFAGKRDAEKEKCPLSRRPGFKCDPAKKQCDNPRCPHRVVTCENPECPFATKEHCPQVLEEKGKFCGPMKRCDNPECPFAGAAMEDCPLVLKNMDGKFCTIDGMTCDNPDCPNAKKCLSEGKGDAEASKKTKRSCSVSKPATSKICDNPSCPFAHPDDEECPLVKSRARKSSEIKPTNYGSPKCPFVHRHEEEYCPYAVRNDGRQCSAPKPRSQKFCDDPNCPFASSDDEECPLVLKRRKKRAHTAPQPICGNPLCPSVNHNENESCPLAKRGKKCADKQKSKSPCANPRCPFASQTGKGDTDSICANPNCPYKQRGSSSSSSSSSSKESAIRVCPQAILKMIDDDNCDNPECPGYFDPMLNKKRNDINEACSNPDCPVNKGKKKRDSKRDKHRDICDNPDCPYASSLSNSDDTEICSNPDCPYAAQTKSDSFCDFPNCPFNKKPKTYCDNPNCPYAPKDNDSICNDPDCPFRTKPTLSACDFPDCPLNKKTKAKFLEPYMTMPDNNEIQAEVKRRGSMSRYVLDEPKPPSEVNEIVQCEEGSEPLQDDKFKSNKPKRRKRKGKYVYSMGDRYPGLKIGHAECNMPVFRVPPKMGWLWNIHTPCLRLKPRRGWKPGAMTKTIAKRLLDHRHAKGLGVPKLPNFSRKKRADGGYESESEESVQPTPTLQIKKKEGCYYITMHPLKDPDTLVDRENPYMECTPLQFKIQKNKPAGNDGDNDGVLCLCDEPAESSSDSELDIEFTPPAGIIHPERFKKKPNIVHIETQYDTKDIAEPKSKKKGKKDKKKGKGGKKGKGKK